MRNRRVAWGFLAWLVSLISIPAIWRATSPVERMAVSVAFSPDGKALAAAFCRPAPDPKGWVLTWDVASRRPLAGREFPGPAFDLAYAPDGSRLAVVGSQGLAMLLDPRTLLDAEELSGHDHREVRKVAFAPNSPMMATVDMDGTIILRGWPGLRELRRIPTGRATDELDFSRDGLLATSHGNILPWDPETGEAITRPGLAGGRGPLAFDRSGPRILVQKTDPKAPGESPSLWVDYETGRIVQKLTMDFPFPRSARVSEDGRRAVMGGDDRMVTVYNLEDGSTLARFGDHHPGSFDHQRRQALETLGFGTKIEPIQPIWSVAITPAATHVASASQTGEIGLWNLSGNSGGLLLDQRRPRWVWTPVCWLCLLVAGLPLAVLRSRKRKGVAERASASNVE